LRGAANHGNPSKIPTDAGAVGVPANGTNGSSSFAPRTAVIDLATHLSKINVSNKIDIE